MKKRLLTVKLCTALVLLAMLIFVPLAFAGISTGDGTWEWKSPSVQGNNINSLSFYNNTIGWAAGSSGLVMKTYDSGTTWYPQVPATSCAGAATGSGCNLRGIDFVDANTGWTAGDYGTIWKSVDGGTTWAGQTSPSPYTYSTLRAVSFFSATQGIIVGDGLALYTTNGGTTWAAGTGISGGSYLYSVQMLDASTAVATGSSGAIYRTVNGGVSWTAVTSGTSKDINGVFFTDTNRGFAVGGGPGGQILRTNTGGTTWEPSAVALTEILNAVTIIDSGNTLIATGMNGVIMRRSTANNWTDAIDTVASGLTTTTTSPANNLYAISFASGSATGYAGGVAGLILGTTTSGGSWTNMAGGPGNSFYGSSWLDASNGWVSGEAATVKKTVNGGDTWTDDNTGLPANDLLQLWSVNFRSSTLGFSVGRDASTSPSTGVGYKYSSGTWSAMTLPAGVLHLGGVRMSSDTSGLAVGKYDDTHGNNGVILRTADGGATAWIDDTISVPGNVIYDINSVDTTASTNGWAAGQANCQVGDCQQDQVGKGAILKYNSGTSNWTATYKTNVSYFSSIDMVDATTGYVVGYQQYSTGVDPTKQWWTYGRIFKTTDGGATWNEQTNGSGGAYVTKVMSSVSFLPDGLHGVATAGNIGDGRVLRTDNGGTTWTVVAAGTNVDLYNAAIVTDGGSPVGFRAYVAGGNNTVIKYPEQIKPTLLDIYPEANSTNVPTNTTATATFSEAVSGVSGSTFTLEKTSGGGPIAAEVTYDPGTKTATLTPGTVASPVELDVSTEYRVSATTGITDQFGNAMDLTNWTFTTNAFPTKDYYWTWYDNMSSYNWLLFANPVGADPVDYNYQVAAYDMTLAADSPAHGTIAAGSSAPARFYFNSGPYAGRGMLGGPVRATSNLGNKAIASQRSLWKFGNSLEEVVGTEDAKQSSHYYWTWYDNKTPGTYDWVMVSNPSNQTIYYRIKIAGSEPAPSTLLEGASSGELLAGGQVSARFNMRTGPVEVETWSDGVGGSTPTPAVASQRVLNNVGTPTEAFNEEVGIALEDLYNDYYWTWYDNVSAGVYDWILISNPNAGSINYRITVKGVVPAQMIEGSPTGTIAAGGAVTPRIANVMDGPVEVKTCIGDFDGSGNCLDAPGAENKSIASQRMLYGPSFEETPGLANDTTTALKSDYHWTWYDMLDPGTNNWVFIANPGGATIYYDITVGGTAPSPAVEGTASGTIAGGGVVHPRFLKRGGPVEVKGCNQPFTDHNCATGEEANIITSQRVDWHGYLNEVWGTYLGP